ncbi:hypothetical protein CCACVL1_20292, partial [Corchorus capsularis]
VAYEENGGNHHGSKMQILEQ